jgi:hypothetical protein
VVNLAAYYDFSGESSALYEQVTMQDGVTATVAQDNAARAIRLLQHDVRRRAMRTTRAKR